MRKKSPKNSVNEMNKLKVHDFKLFLIEYNKLLKQLIVYQMRKVYKYYQRQKRKLSILE